MKPFNLEAAKRGEPIVTRSGRPAKFVGHFPELVPSCRIYIQHENTGALVPHCEDGSLWGGIEDVRDLFMAPKKRTVWVNLYIGGNSSHFNSKEEADRFDLITDRVGGKAYPLEIEE